MIETFCTDDGHKVPAITTDQMREVDRVAMEETGPNLFQMMENAGRNLAELTMEILDRERAGGKVVVLAGVGGNGGGGICAARHLANHDRDVALCLADEGSLTEVPAWQLAVYRSAEGRELAFDQLEGQEPDLIIDALLGYSLRGAPRGAAANLIDWANGTGADILSLDVPSGVDSTTGETPGSYIRAKWTMTLALPKTGLLPERTGQLILADIGIPKMTYTSLDLAVVSPFGHRFRVPLPVVSTGSDEPV